MKRQAAFFFMNNENVFLTKCEVKMAGYWSKNEIKTENALPIDNCFSIAR